MNNPPRIHHTADVSPDATIGANTSVWNNCQIREDARIGQGCIVGKDAYIDFGVSVGDHVKIQNGALLYHGLTVESGVFIGPGAIFTNDKLPRAIAADGSLKGQDDWTVGEIRLCYGASIGAGSVVLPDVTIGRFALVGAGSVVTKDVPDQGLVVGNPARLVGRVCKCARKLTQVGQDTYHCPACNIEYSFEE